MPIIHTVTVQNFAVISAPSTYIVLVKYSQNSAVYFFCTVHSGTD